MTEQKICILDNECRENELCYTNTSNFDELSFRNNTLVGCACNAWYGWKGEDCDVFSFGTIFFFLIAATCAVFSVIAFGIALMSFYYHFRKLPTWKSSNSRTTTSFFLTLSNIGVFLWVLIAATSHLATSGNFLGSQAFVDRDPYKGRHNVIGFFAGGVGIIFLGATLVTICFVWLEIAQQVRSEKRFTVDQVQRYRWVLYAFIIFAFLTLALSQLFQRNDENSAPNILGFTLFPHVLFIIVLFGFASYQITRVLAEFSGTRAMSLPQSGLELTGSSHVDHYVPQEPSPSILTKLEPKLVRAIKFIRNTTRVSCVILAIFVTSLFIFSVIDVHGKNKFGGLGWRNSVYPGSNFPFAKILYYITIVASTALNCVLTRYVLFEYLSK